MDNRWMDVLFAGGFAGAATVLGMYLILARQKWSRRNSANLLSYSAGVLLGVGFLHILPEAQELSAQAPYYCLLAFVLFYFMEHHLLIHASHEELHHTSLDEAASHGECCAKPHPLGLVAFFGLALHSLIDGMIIGTGYEASAEMGLLSSIGVIAHEVPEGIAMLSILLHYGHSRQRAVALTSIVAVATPLGAVVTYALVHHISEQLLGNLMALAAGSFIYIAASDLIPESHRARGVRGTLALIAGGLTAILAGMVTHGH